MSRPTRVVIAEGDTPLRLLLAATLAAAGHEVVDLEDGVAVLELLGEDAWRPDVVIVDADLPRLTGLDVLDELRQLSPPIPVILLSEVPQRALELQARRHGAFAFLEMPFEAELLVGAVRRATLGTSYAGPPRPASGRLRVRPDAEPQRPAARRASERLVAVWRAWL